MRVLALSLLLLSPACPGSAQNASWPDLSTPARGIGGGEHDAAVVVGAEKYAFVEHVVGAKQNALDWQAYLTETRKVPAEHVALLLDNDAVADQILQAAAEKAAQVGPGGTLWFVFVGHGAPSKDGKDGLLIGIDAQQKAESLYSRSLMRGELLAALAKGRQAQTVVVLDACFSGKAPSGQALVAGLQPLVALHAQPQGVDERVVLMTAARSDQFAGPLPGGRRPAFSYLALGGLRGWAADAQGAVTASGVINYARKVLSFSRDRQQTPELSANRGGGVVLGTGREDGPDLSKLQRRAAESSGGGFQVTNLPSVPEAQAPQALDETMGGQLDFREVDIAALERYNAVFELDKNAEGSPEEKARAWRRLAQDDPKFVESAEKRAAAWDAFAIQMRAAEAALQKRFEARDEDWRKLGQLLRLAVVQDSEKARWSDRFLQAYMKSPGLDPEMAQGLAVHATGAATKEFLKKLAASEPQVPIERPPEGLETSDEFTRRQLGAVSSSSLLNGWLKESDLIRRAVKLILPVAYESRVVGLELSVLAPRGAFQAAKSAEGRLVETRESHARFDAFAAMVASLNVRRAARLLDAAAPLLDRACLEAAAQDKAKNGAYSPYLPVAANCSFKDTLLRAVRHLVAAPVPDNASELRGGADGDYFYYVDESLERLSNAQKQLLRMGPANHKKVHSKLRELETALSAAR